MNQPESKSSVSGNQYPRDSQVQILHLKGPCRWRHYIVQPNGESALALVGNQPIPTMYEVCEQGENISLTGQEEEEGRRWQGKFCFQKGHCFFRSSKEGGRVSQYTRKAIAQEVGEAAWFERDQHSMGAVEKPFVWKWFCGNISRLCRCILTSLIFFALWTNTNKMANVRKLRKKGQFLRLFHGQTLVRGWGTENWCSDKLDKHFFQVLFSQLWIVLCSKS